MATLVLATKLYIPLPRPKVVLRPRLTARLNQGLDHKLILISAPAGFGKTTLVSEWVSTLTPGPSPSGRGEGVRVAWLSLDEGDKDPTRFLAYLVAALQTIEPNIGAGLLAVLQSPQPPPIESILTTLLNEVALIPDKFVLAIDDYHVIDAKPVDTATSVDDALAFLLEHMPPRMHLVIATREDPNLPLARYRVRGQMTELRAADLRFTPAEAANFFNQVMGLYLSEEDIAALETRTEGWIAGLQLAALALQGLSSIQGQPDTAGFIQSFTGSHRFVLDYLVEEVLQQQSESVQAFLLRTSILDRICGPLCEVVLGEPSLSGGEMLEYLERLNLFIVPLDNERRWYRYHHLFAELLRHRLQQNPPPLSSHRLGGSVAELHIRASEWYENNGLEIEAFQHAVAANDVERAARLIEGKGMPLQFRGALSPVLNWLRSLPATELDARPSLWVMYASALSMVGQLAEVEPKLQAAEAALQGAEPDDRTRNLIGHIAAIRALLAAAQYQPEEIIAQSRRALEYLHPDNLPVRTATIWKIGIAYQLQGDRLAAGQAYSEAIAISQASGNLIINIAATSGLGTVQESENQLHLADKTYQRVLQLAGESLQPATCDAYLGLARIAYEWNDLEAAQRHGQKSLLLARQFQTIDRAVAGELFLARLKLAQGDPAGATTLLAQAGQSARQHNFTHRLPEIAAAQVLVLLQQGDLAAAAPLAQTHNLPISLARVHLAQGNPSGALRLLEPLRRQAEAKGWQDERLKLSVLQAIAHQAHDQTDSAVELLGEALRLAERGGFIRIFLDEGIAMAHLLSNAAFRRTMPVYVNMLLAAFIAEEQNSKAEFGLPFAQILIEPLSQRELEVLQLIALGLSNREISQRLFLAPDTVKGHNRRIFDKLQVQRRTEAVARAHELGLL